MQVVRYLTRSDGVVSVDWTLVVVALVALGLASGAFVKSGIGNAANEVALPALGPDVLPSDHHLIAIEDFEAGAPQWRAGRVEDQAPGFGGILGRYGGTGGAEGVWRTYDLPAGVSHLEISFDLHAIDDWRLEDVVIFADGVELARRSFSTRPEMMGAQRLLMAPDHEGLDLIAEARTGARRDRGYAQGRPATEDQTLRVRIRAYVPEGSFTLGFGSTLARPPYEASWAVDNIRVVAMAPQPG